MSENGGNDDQSFDKIYEILTQTPCPTFDSGIVVLKQVNVSNLDVVLLLIKDREGYRALVAEGTWYNRQKNNNGHTLRTKRAEPRNSDLVALLSIPTSGKNYIKALRADIKPVSANLAPK